jgi:hypothetical protein
MNEGNRNKAAAGAILKWLFIAAFAAAVLLSGLFSGLMHRAGLVYLVLGSVAVALMGFSGREMGAAFRFAAGRQGPAAESRRAAVFWEAAARNAWLLGVLGSALNFTVVLGRESGGIEDVGNRMIQAFIVSLYGLVLSVICLAPALKIMDGLEGTACPKPPAAAEGSTALPDRSAVLGRVIGYILFAAVLGSTLYALTKGRPQTGALSMGKILLHGPAILVVAGGTIALALFLNAGARGLTLGFAMTGFISLLMGFIQALFGFMHRSINEIVSAIAFIISASSFSLLGMLVIAAPFEDREVMKGRRERPGALSRMFWIVFPLLAFIFLVLTFLMVITPMKQKAGG